MIDVAHETLLTLGQATALFPRKRNGKRTSGCTVWRWATQGYRGVRLETVSVAGCLCTTAACVNRFLAEMTANDPRCTGQGLSAAGNGRGRPRARPADGGEALLRSAGIVV